MHSKIGKLDTKEANTGAQLEITELQKCQRRAICKEASVIVSYINGNDLPSPVLLSCPGCTGASPSTSMGLDQDFLHQAVSPGRCFGLGAGPCLADLQCWSRVFPGGIQRILLWVAWMGWRCFCLSLGFEGISQGFKGSSGSCSNRSTEWKAQIIGMVFISLWSDTFWPHFCQHVVTCCGQAEPLGCFPHL